MSSETSAAPDRRLYFHATAWLPAYTVCCVLGSLPLLLVTAPLGFSVASDAVFGFVVMIGGGLGDHIFRKLSGRVMYLIGDLPMIWAWPALGLFVAIVRPLE